MNPICPKRMFSFQNGKSEHREVQNIQIGQDANFPRKKEVTLIKNTVTIYLWMLSLLVAHMLRSFYTEWQGRRSFCKFRVVVGIFLGCSGLSCLVMGCSGSLLLLRTTIHNAFNRQFLGWYFEANTKDSF